MIDEQFLEDLGNAEKFRQFWVSVRQSDGRLMWSFSNPDGSYSVGTVDTIPEALADLQESIERGTGKKRTLGFDRPRRPRGECHETHDSVVADVSGRDSQEDLEADMMDMLG